ncbi:MAG: hypothetical protein KBC33_03010 [Candidatus Pacebacteria bacterium]|nr:hypothetical protein [Candidatus Paceibacterota bacterium]
MKIGLVVRKKGIDLFHCVRKEIAYMSVWMVGTFLTNGQNHNDGGTAW